MGTKKNIAVVLSGCGVYDGAEIHESVFTMLAIARNGGSYQVFAPDIEQYHVVNHLTGQPVDEKRNVLVEAARIARGDIKPLSEYNPDDFDAIMFPGGFGVAKNFSTFAFDGPDCSVNPEVEKVILDTNKAGKPIGALCISPVVVAKVLEGAEVTIGNDKDTIDALEKMGAKHRFTTHGEVVIDNKYKVATTPCYMLDATIDQIATGAENVVKAVMEMTE
ncbi:MAG: isoprenoid biosynthesis glyoxalase ElbB [Chlorobi bacterium]|nr:isoprenoid biosynthesis glyoxalase ElbB [Chlorobiota bacterium]